MILIIDNYDSFTQNLVQCIGHLGFDMQVRRNDEISIQDVVYLRPSHIILSPGPGDPSNSGISLDLIERYASTIPILGVCLGHQCIGSIAGNRIKQLDEPVHGKTSKIFHNGTDLFNGIPNPFIATRYHSLIIDHKYMSNELDVTAWTHEGTIMACRHKKKCLLRGVQFHPESLWTQYGIKIIENFLLA
uniref:Anthranilate synthase component 2 n=1 Tax=Eucheuma denticulatum TaxID=305493 RepID=A0A8E7PGB8_9FLOR|nr:anthranilate synthase component II [Eucheuma denticulatum]